MDITGQFVLPADIAVVAAGSLSPEVRASCQCGEDDFVLTRARSRVRSMVVNRETADLLGHFREPTTLVEAVLRLCLKYRTDPELTLETAYRAVRPLLEARWLVPATSKDRFGILQSLNPGDAVGGFSVRDCIQVLEDTEVYQVMTPDGGAAAMKIARPGAPTSVHDRLRHEARVLEHIGGPPAPQLIARGRHEGDEYLVASWCPGVWVDRAAAEVRWRTGGDQRAGLLGLCRRVLEAFARLHAAGIVHGDISPRNVLVDQGGEVAVVDFGSAVVADDPNPFLPPRHWVPEYLEPELAAAFRRGETQPAPSMAGDQYGLAALIYHLLTGHHRYRFAATPEGVWDQVAGEMPLRFVEVGQPAWPAAEAVLATALSTNPSDRFSSLAEFRLNLDAVELPGAPAARAAGRTPLAPAALLDRVGVLDPVTAGTAPDHPLCSVSHGAAGVAYALYRSAVHNDDPRLLARADAWVMRAESLIDHPRAFYSDRLDLGDAQIGRSSVLFGRPGVHLVHALIAHAMGDSATLGTALRAYASSCRHPTTGHDLAAGRAGNLLGCVLLLRHLGPATEPQVTAACAPLVELGDALAADLSGYLAGRDPTGPEYLGIAHGRAGILYALLMWAEYCRRRPDGVLHELDGLSRLACGQGNGVRWPVQTGSGGGATWLGPLDSWCHGAPGYVYLWTAAYRVFGDDRHLELGVRSATATWETTRSIGNLCCGDAGRAYAMLCAARHTGDRTWLGRAGELAASAASKCRATTDLSLSLLKGELGAAVLAEDMHFPESAAFPLFEPIG